MQMDDLADENVQIEDNSFVQMSQKIKMEHKMK